MRGEFARIQGARVPAHLVASAKSWLCHPGGDREADILPWGAPPGAHRLSPVEASADYLRHVRDAWNHQFAADDPARRHARRDRAAQRRSGGCSPASRTSPTTRC